MYFYALEKKLNVSWSQEISTFAQTRSQDEKNTPENLKPKKCNNLKFRIFLLSLESNVLEAAVHFN